MGGTQTLNSKVGTLKKLGTELKSWKPSSGQCGPQPLNHLRDGGDAGVFLWDLKSQERRLVWEKRPHLDFQRVQPFDGRKIHNGVPLVGAPIPDGGGQTTYGAKQFDLDLGQFGMRSLDCPSRSS